MNQTEKMSLQSPAVQFCMAPGGEQWEDSQAQDQLKTAEAGGSQPVGGDFSGVRGPLRNTDIYIMIPDSRKIAVIILKLK